jgi:hypothetical protein
MTAQQKGRPQSQPSSQMTAQQKGRPQSQPSGQMTAQQKNQYLGRRANWEDVRKGNQQLQSTAQTLYLEVPTEENKDREWEVWFENMLQQAGDLELQREEVHKVMQDLQMEGLEVKPHGSVVSGALCVCSDVDVATNERLPVVAKLAYAKFEVEETVWSRTKENIEAVVLHHVASKRRVHIISDTNKGFATSYAMACLFRDILSTNRNAMDCVRVAKLWLSFLGRPKHQKSTMVSSYILTLIACFVMQRSSNRLLPSITISKVFDNRSVYHLRRAAVGQSAQNSEDWDGVSESASVSSHSLQKPVFTITAAPEDQIESKSHMKYKLNALHEREAKRAESVSGPFVFKEVLSFLRSEAATTVMDLRDPGEGKPKDPTNNTWVVVDPFLDEELVAATKNLDHFQVVAAADDTLADFFGARVVPDHALKDKDWSAFLRPHAVLEDEPVPPSSTSPSSPSSPG